MCAALIMIIIIIVVVVYKWVIHWEEKQVNQYLVLGK